MNAHRRQQTRWICILTVINCFLFLIRLQPGPDVYPKLQDLPEECIREVILRINDHRDLEASSAAWTLMAALASEQRVWRELTQFHFTKQQIDQMIQKQFSSNDVNATSNSEQQQSSSTTAAAPAAAPTPAPAPTSTDSSNKCNDVNRNNFNRSETKASKRFSNTKDWQQIYHALRR